MANQQIFTPDWLVENAKRAHSGVDVKTTPREILGHFDKERRHPDTILSIRKALRKLQVKTSPRFYSVNLDTQISLLPSDKRLSEDEPKEDSRQPIITFGMLQKYSHPNGARLRKLLAHQESDIRHPEVFDKLNLGLPGAEQI